MQQILLHFLPPLSVPRLPSVPGEEGAGHLDTGRVPGIRVHPDPADDGRPASVKGVEPGPSASRQVSSHSGASAAVRATGRDGHLLEAE